MKQVKLKRLIIAVLLATISTPILADDPKQKVSKDQELYTMGNEAYQKKDYVSALKYLFAYRVVNANELARHEEFLVQLDKAIEISEHKIRNAIKHQDEYSKKEEIYQRRFEGAAK